MIDEVIFTAQNFRIDWDEDGCHMVIATDEASLLRFHVNDPEQLYDRVKGAIGPWLRERDEARAHRTRAHIYGGLSPIESAAAYDISDPKHPDHHSVHADIWDAREGK